MHVIKNACVSLSEFSWSALGIHLGSFWVVLDPTMEANIVLKNKQKHVQVLILVTFFIICGRSGIDMVSK